MTEPDGSETCIKMETRQHWPDDLNIGIVGYKFMGKAHSNAYHKAAHASFDLPIRPVLKVACGRHENLLKRVCRQLGLASRPRHRGKRVVERADIDLIDISSPTNTHKDDRDRGRPSGKTRAL